MAAGNTGDRPGGWCGAFTRLRHFCGHGIHSPFVYELVRAVFTKRNKAGTGRLYSCLRAEGAGRKTAGRIQNLYDFCGFSGYGVIGGRCGADGNAQGAEMVVAAEGVTAERLRDMLASDDWKACVVLRPYRSRMVAGVCNEAAARQQRLTIDAKSMFIIFGRGREPKQHFKI